jgi:hypothetical protein
MRNTWSYGIVTATLASACAWAPQVHSSTDHERGRAGSIVVAQSSAMARFKGTCFDRTELFFGSGKPDGSAVSEAEFQQSIDQEITPRFPDGLTLLTGLGQFRGSSGDIVRERSMLLILLYPPDTRRASSESIEMIREKYKSTFQQESVLRADRRCDRVGF